MSDTRYIEISRERLIAGKPCWIVEGAKRPWRGFECDPYGVIIVKAEGGKAWIEFHGDTGNLREGGNVFTPGGGELEQIGWNLLPPGQLERLRSTPGLYFGAVNRSRVQRGHVAACTVYGYENGERRAVLCPSYRFDGPVRSTVMVPPDLRMGEPLNAWVEVNVNDPRGRVEY